MGEKGKTIFVEEIKTYPVPPVARIVTICLAVVVFHLQLGAVEERKRRSSSYDMLIFQPPGVPRPASSLTYA